MVWTRFCDSLPGHPGIPCPSRCSKMSLGRFRRGLHAPQGAFSSGPGTLGCCEAWEGEKTAQWGNRGRMGKKTPLGQTAAPRHEADAPGRMQPRQTETRSQSTDGHYYTRLCTQNIRTSART